MDDKTRNFTKVINLKDYRNQKRGIDDYEINELADLLMYRAYIPEGNALAPLLHIRGVRSNRQALVSWLHSKMPVIASLKEEGCDLLDGLEHELNLALLR